MQHRVLALAMAIFTHVGSSNAIPGVMNTLAARQMGCQYTTRHGAALAKANFVTISAHVPTLAECRAACTRERFCGNIQFRPPRNTSDENCSFHQQNNYEPFPVRSAPASHVVLSVKRGSCNKDVAKQKPLKCTPGIVTFKGTPCKYNVTCGVMLDLQLAPMQSQETAFTTIPTLPDALRYHAFPDQPGNKGFPGSNEGESLSYSEGGFLIELASPYYDVKHTVPNRNALVYQIVKNSCNKKAAKPKS